MQAEGKQALTRIRASTVLTLQTRSRGCCCKGDNQSKTHRVTHPPPSPAGPSPQGCSKEPRRGERKPGFVSFKGLYWVCKAGPAGLAVRMSMRQVTRTQAGRPSNSQDSEKCPGLSSLLPALSRGRELADTHVWQLEVLLRGQTAVSRENRADLPRAGW